MSNVHLLSIEPIDEGEKELAADVRATCGRLRFTKLEILDSESTADDEVCKTLKLYNPEQSSMGHPAPHVHKA